MTNIETTINQDTATQVDIDDVLPNPMDAVKDAVKQLNSRFTAIQKGNRATVELRDQVRDIREQIKQAAESGDDDMLQALSRQLRTANNKLDRAIEKSTDATLELEDLKQSVINAVGAVR